MSALVAFASYFAATPERLAWYRQNPLVAAVDGLALLGLLAAAYWDGAKRLHGHPPPAPPRRVKRGACPKAQDRGPS